MLECIVCKRLFNSSTCPLIPGKVSYVFALGFCSKVLEGDKFYVYKCSSCSKTSAESFERLNISWYCLPQDESNDNSYLLSLGRT